MTRLMRRAKLAAATQQGKAVMWWVALNLASAVVVVYACLRFFRDFRWKNLRERWNNLPPSVKKAAKPLSWAIVVSTALTVIAYSTSALYFGLQISLRPDKVFSFIDAVLAGIVAFALLGAFTFLASVRRPEEEALDERISFLYSARREDGHAFNQYLKEQVMLLGAAVVSATFKYEYVEVSADKRFLRTAVTMAMRIANTMKHDTYRQNMPLRIKVPVTDGIAGTLGNIFYVQTRARAADGRYAERVEWLPNIRPLTATDNEFAIGIDLEIPPAGELAYEYMFDCWEPLARPDFSGANRFIEQATLEFVNKTTHVIHVDPLTSPGGAARPHIPIDRALKLDPGEQGKLTVKGLPPDKVVGMAISVHV